MPTPFTLHVRLTHACNASCSYCSSWQQDPGKRMRLPEFSACLDTLESFWASVGISPDFLNVEYVGGELLLVPPDELAAIVLHLRERFSGRMQVRDGAQSNLIASKARVDSLYDLFEGRIGTSVDNFSNQRQLGREGSEDVKAKRYRQFTLETQTAIHEQHQRIIPGVLTIDGHNINRVADEVSLAMESGRDLVLRPVFQGGCTIDGITDVDLGIALADAFDRWVAGRMKVYIDPFVSLMRRRMGIVVDTGFCAWQRDCGVKSLSIEPNGDAFLCQELADMGQLKLGNLIEGNIDYTTHTAITRRVEMLDKGCFECPYFQACQGGCMQQSLEVGRGLYGKTQWCHAWKQLFKKIDELILTLGHDRLANRLTQLFGS